MGTKIIKIKRFPIEKCSNFMAGYTQKEKTENENETKCIQNLLFGLPKSYYKKKEGRIRYRNAALPYYFGSVYGLITINYKLSIHGDILVHVLAANQRIVEHIGHGKEVNEVAGHVTHEVGEPALNERKHAATNYHHHEDTAGLGCILAKSLGGQVEDAGPHDGSAETTEHQQQGTHGHHG